jgi:hypothetical protein
VLLDKSEATKPLPIPTLHDHVICKFDAFVSFLALAREEGFELIRRECEVWFRPEQLQAIPDTYQEYRCQVAHAAYMIV